MSGRGDRIAVIAGAIVFLASVSVLLLAGPLASPGMIGHLYTDGVQQGYFWKLFYQRTILDGAIPIWNPHVFLGIPFLGNPLSASFYPFSVLFLATSIEQAYKVFFTIHLSLAGTFMFLLARQFGLRDAPALFAALAYMLNANFIGYVFGGMHAEVSVLVWLPLAVLLFHRLLSGTSSRLSGVLLLGLVVGVQILGGHPQRVFFTGLVLGCYGLWWGWNRHRNVLRSASTLLPLAGAACVALSLAAVQTLPAFEAMRLSSRAPFPVSGFSLDRELFFGSYNPARLVTFVVPDLFGDPVSLRPARSDWLSLVMDDVHTIELQAYVGVTPLVLALFALRGSSVQAARFFRIVAGLGLVLAMGRFLLVYPVLHWLFPPMRTFRVPARFLSIVVFALSFLAGCGLQELMNRNVAAHIFRRWGRSLLAIGAIMLALVLVGSLWRESAYATGDRMLQYLIEVKQRGQRYPLNVWQGLVVPAYDMALVGTLKAGVLMGATALLFFRGARGAVGRTGALFALVLVTIDLGSFAMKFMVTEDLAALMRRNREVVDPMLDGGELYRMLPLYSTESRRLDDVLGPTDNAVVQYGLFSFAGYEPYELQRYSRLRLALARQIERGSTSLADMLNIKWILARDRLETEEWPLLKDGPVKLYRNPRAMSRAWICDGVRVVPDEAAALAALERNEIDPRAEVILAGRLPPGVQPSVPSSPCRPLRASMPTPNAYHVRVDTPQPGIVVLSEMYFPGWHAFVDGAETLVYPVNYCLKGVSVPAGVHEVRFQYAPTSFRAGAVISLASLVGVLIALIGVPFIRGRGTPTQSQPERAQSVW